MNSDNKVSGILSRGWGFLLLLLAAIAAMLAPFTVHAGSCMDGKLSCSVNYSYNDTQVMISFKLDYHPILSTPVTTRVECNRISDGTNDMTCSSIVKYTYVYVVNTNGTTRIKNPGYSPSGGLCETVCSALGIAVYYLSGGPVY